FCANFSKSKRLRPTASKPWPMRSSGGNLPRLQFRLHAGVRETGTSLSQDVTRALQLTSRSGKLVDLSIEKLAGEFGRGLASLEDFFFGLILEFCVLVQGKTIFSRKDANLF